MTFPQVRTLEVSARQATLAGYNPRGRFDDQGHHLIPSIPPQTTPSSIHSVRRFAYSSSGLGVERAFKSSCCFPKMKHVIMLAGNIDGTSNEGKAGRLAGNACPDGSQDIGHPWPAARVGNRPAHRADQNGPIKSRLTFVLLFCEVSGSIPAARHIPRAKIEKGLAMAPALLGVSTMFLRARVSVNS